MLIFAMGFVALGGQASAQRPGAGGDDEPQQGSYVSELTDLEITFSEDWELDDSEVFDDEPATENVYLFSDAGSLTLSFISVDAYEDPEELLTDYLDNMEADADVFDVVDQDANRGFAWALVAAELSDGTAVTMYVDVDDSFSDDFFLVATLYAEEGDFLDQYELVNDTVEVDGGQILGEFSVDEIDEILGGGSTSRGDDQQAVDDEPTPDDTNATETGGDDANNDRGSSTDSYAFETVDLEVTVSGDVEIDDTFESRGSEEVLLLGSGSIAQVRVFEDPSDPEDALSDYFSDFLSGMDDGEEIDSGVESGVAWAVYTVTTGGLEFYVYATVDDSRFEGLNYLEMIAAPVDAFEDEFISIQESVEVDGDPMFADVDVDDVLQIIEG